MLKIRVFSSLLSVLCFYGAYGFDERIFGETLSGDVSSIRSLKSAATASGKGKDPQSGKMQNIGGKATSTPCCVSWEPGRVDCFIRGADANVKHMTKSGGEYGEWVDIRGEGIGYVECVSRRKGIIELMGQAKDNSLQWASYDGEAWSAWKNLGGTIREAPSCVVGVNNRVDCNARNKAGRLVYTRSLKEGTWPPLQLTTWEYHSEIKCMQRYSKQYNCWGSSPVNQFRNFWRFTGGTWGGRDLTNYEDKVQSKPSACGWEDGYRCDVFVLGIQSQMLHIHGIGHGPASWQPIEDLGGKFTSTPQCVSNNVDTIHCIGVAIDSKLYRRSFENGKWGEWVSGCGGFLDGNYCLRTSPDEVSCYMRGLTKTVVEVVYALL